jgi:oligoribonuclease NrnB/cAMP/cGMP phosphodiesterase (DHH superfamily)
MEQIQELNVVTMEEYYSPDFNRDQVTDVIIYHMNCLDGAGAAAIVLMALADSPVDCALLCPADYKDIIDPACFEGRDVYMVDFSAAPVVMQSILDTCNSLIWLDHHISAIEKLRDWYESIDTADLDQIIIYLSEDNSMSGAGLAWEFFYPMQTMPMWVRHIQDRDLWRFDLENTKPYCAALYGMNKVDPIQLAWNADTTYETMLDIGKILVAKQEREVTALADGAITAYDDLSEPVYALTYAPSWYASDLGDVLGLKAPCAIIAQHRGQDVKVSLRSNTNNTDWVDVRKIAELFGGGGHINAAGFTTRVLDMEGVLLGIYNAVLDQLEIQDLNSSELKEPE